MKRTDRISSLTILALCIPLLVRTRRFSPLSALFPRVVLVILASLALLLFVLTFLRNKDGESFDSASFRHVPSLITLLLMVAWGLLIPVIGFLVTSLIFFPLITVYLDRQATGRKKMQRVGLTLGMTLVFYLFFARVLFVPFPEGFLV